MNSHVQEKSKASTIVQLVAEALAGCGAGLVCAFLVGLAGAALFKGSSSGFGDLIAGILGALIGYTIGVSIGVYLLGRRLNGRGSYWMALLGSVVGAALIMLVAEPLRLNLNPALLQGVLIASAPLFATLMFTMSAKVRR